MCIYIALSSFVQFVCHYVFIAIAWMSGSHSNREPKKPNKTFEAYFFIISSFDLTKNKKRDHPENIYKWYDFSFRKLYLYMSLQYKSIIQSLHFLELNLYG